MPTVEVLALARALKAAIRADLQGCYHALNGVPLSEELPQLAHRVAARALMHHLIHGASEKADAVIAAFGLRDATVRECMVRAAVNFIQRREPICILSLLRWRDRTVEVLTAPPVVQAISDRLEVLYSQSDLPATDHKVELSFLSLFTSARATPDSARDAKPLNPEAAALVNRAFREGKPDVARALCARYGLFGEEPPAGLRESFYQGVVTSLTASLPYPARCLNMLWKDLCPDDAFTPDLLPENVQQLVKNLELSSFGSMLELAHREPEYFAYLCNNPDVTPKLGVEHQPDVEALFVRYREAELLLQGGFELGTFLGDSPDFAGLASALRTVDSGWQDDGNVWEPFTRAVAAFGVEEGPKAIFEFMAASKRSRHDVLHRFDVLITLGSQLGEQWGGPFVRNVLLQAARDKGMFVDPVSSHAAVQWGAPEMLLTLAAALPPDLSSAITLVADAPLPNEELERLRANLNTPKKILSSWSNLFKFFELWRGVAESGFTRLLTTRMHESPLYGYLGAIAQGRRVPLSILMEIHDDPQKFWNRSDAQDNFRLHAFLKPGGYFEQDHIDLNASELLRALVDGRINRAKVLPACSIDYFTRPGERTPLTIAEGLRLALGSREAQVLGAARNQGKLFSAVNRALKAHGLTVREVIGGSPLAPDLADEICTLILDCQIGLPEGQLTALKAVLHRADDPDAFVVNALFPFCMQPGTGKFNQYHMSPGCGLFTVSGRNELGAYGLASSVLTMNLETGKSFWDMTDHTAEKAQHLETVIPEQVLTQPRRLVVDNVELNDNRAGIEERMALTTLYADFLDRYLHVNAADLDIDPQWVGIGHSHEESEILTCVDSWENTTVSGTILVYSDNWKRTGRKLIPASQQLLRRVVLQDSVSTPRKVEAGLRPVLPDDVLPIAKLEYDAYRDVPDLLNGALDIQMTLETAALKNTAANRPNLSRLSIDKNSVIDGYLIAYQGVFGNDVLSRPGIPAPKDAVVYVDDIVSRKGSRAGTKLMKEFARLYATHYGDPEHCLPLFMQCRGSSTAKHIPFMERQLNETLRSTGSPIRLEARIIEREVLGEESLVHVLFARKGDGPEVP